MKKTKKVLLIMIIFSIVGITIFPVFNIIFEKLNISKNGLWTILDKITDTAIVRASDTDYEYEGNLYLSWYEPGMYWPHDEEYNGVGIYIYKAWASPTLEYSVNDSEFKEFEVQDFGTYVLNLDKDVNTVISREKNTQDIVQKALVIKKDDFYIVFQHATVGHNKGNYVYTLYADKDENIEYSLNNGETFYKIENYRLDGTIPRTYWPAQNKVNDSETLFDDKIIVRNSVTKDIMYQTPNLVDIDEITENYSYEDGKTKVKFSINNEKEYKTKYFYVIDNQEFEGDEIELEENKNIKLKVVAEIDFMEQEIEKDIEVKVVNVEKPTVNVNEANELEIIPGEIINDELEGIYYSIDEKDEQKYNGKVELKLEPGEYELNAYQKTKNGAISEQTKKIINIKEKETTEETQEVEYKIIEGENQTHLIGTNTELTIKANGDISEFKAVKVDGKILDSESYQVVSGSTVVTLKQAYLNSLQAGTHTLTFVYTNGEVSTNFVIAKAEIKNNNNNSTPKTGDNIIIWAVLMLASILGIVSTIRFIKKRN